MNSQQKAFLAAFWETGNVCLAGVEERGAGLTQVAERRGRFGEALCRVDPVSNPRAYVVDGSGVVVYLTVAQTSRYLCICIARLNVVYQSLVRRSWLDCRLDIKTCDHRVSSDG